MFLAPTVHPTHMQSAFRVEFIEGNVSDTWVPNEAFLLKCTFISDLNQDAALCIDVIEAYCVYYILLIWLSRQKLLAEGLWGKTNRSNYLKSHQLWMSFFTAFLVVSVWMSCVSKHVFFTSQPWHLSASILMIVDITLKVLWKSILDIELYPFCLFFLSSFLMS